MEKMSGGDMTRALFGIVHERNLKNRDKGAPCYSLAEALERKNVTALRKMCGVYGVSGYSKRDKAGIIPALAAEMAEPERLAKFLFLLDEMEWELFQKATTKRAVVDDKLLSDNYPVLLKLGLMYLYYDGDHFNYVVPSEIRKAYRALVRDGFPAEKKHADSLRNYAVAAVNLYGVIRQDDFMGVFNSQNERKTDIAEISDVLGIHASLDGGYCLYDAYIVDDSFEDGDFKDVAPYAEAVATKPRYLPGKEEFLKFSDWNYIEETPQLSRLRTFLTLEVTHDEDAAEDLLEEFYFLCKYEAKMRRYFDLLEESGYSPGRAHRESLIALITELHNNTRLWLNNGHTPNELIGLLGPRRKKPDRAEKVGRNDPCPCGSGKKFKKCCGQ